MNGVFKLKQDASMGRDLNFTAGQEFELVNRVVYMGGHPVPPNMQGMFLNWITGNPNLFQNVTVIWKKGGQNNL